MTPRTSESGSRPAWLGSVGVLLAAALIILAVRQWVVTPYRVDSTSMAPTVTAGSTVFVTRMGVRGGDAQVQDIVAFDGTHGLMLKRVVGVAGDEVSIVDAVLHRNGVPVEEPYVDLARLDGVFFPPVAVPDGHLFVMGDNRFPSIDSRTFGPVSVAEVTGRLWDPFGVLTTGSASG